jgi:predicted nucleic acid-binding protein
MDHNRVKVTLNPDTQTERLTRERALRELRQLKEGDDQIAFNSKAEKVFGKLLCELVDEFDGRLHKKQAIAETAYRLNLSTVTTKRYLDKHTTRQASFSIRDDVVLCKRCGMPGR